jgi:hypothetical protein
LKHSKNLWKLWQKTMVPKCKNCSKLGH